MKPLLKRLALNTVMLSGMLTAMPCLAVAPNDYAMPYTTGQSQDGSTTGIKLVSSAQFAQQASLVADGVRIHLPQLHRSGRLRGGEYIDFRPQLLTWSQTNLWALANLRGGLNPTPVQVSSENAANTACFTRSLARDLRNAVGDALIYQLPGADGNCQTTPNNAVRAISLNDAASTSPIDLPLVDINFQGVYSGNGVLRDVYAFDRNTLHRFSTDLRTSSVIGSAIQSLQFFGHTEAGVVVAAIDGNLRRISRGRLIPRALKRAGRGFRVGQALIDGEDVYFLEVAVDPTARIQGRIYRVPADGSGSAQLLVSLRARGLIAGLSDTRVIFTAGGGFDPATGMQSASDLSSVPRDGSAAAVRLHRAARGGIGVAYVSADRVFFTVTNFDLASFTTKENAFISADTGTRVSNFRPGSAWSGTQFSGEEEVRLVLSSRGRDGTINGARVFSFDPIDLSAVPLTTLAPAERIFIGFGTGPGSIGLLGAATPSGLAWDVFAFDLFGNRFLRLSTDAGASDELPVF